MIEVTTNLGRSVANIEPGLLHGTSSCGPAIGVTHPVHSFRHRGLMLLLLGFTSLIDSVVLEWVHGMFHGAGYECALSCAVVPRWDNPFAIVDLSPCCWDDSVIAERPRGLVTSSIFPNFDLSSDFCQLRSRPLESISTHNLRWNGVFTQSRIDLFLSDNFEFVELYNLVSFQVFDV